MVDHRRGRGALAVDGDGLLDRGDLLGVRGFLGFDGLHSSGGDRTDIALPEAQQQLLEAVGATGKPLVVVLMNGSALAVPWAKQHAAAILEAWYPGEAGGEAGTRLDPDRFSFVDAWRWLREHARR